MKDIRKEIDLDALTDFNNWEDTSINLIDYAGMKLTPDVTIAVIELFFPEFILHEDTILFRHKFNEDTFNNWFEQFKGDLTRLEKFLNTIYVADLFPNQHFEGHPYHNIEYIGKCLKKAWAYELSQQFPEKDIEMIDYKSESHYDYVISFWQKRDS